MCLGKEKKKTCIQCGDTNYLVRLRRGLNSSGIVAVAWGEGN